MFGDALLSSRPSDILQNSKMPSDTACNEAVGILDGIPGNFAESSSIKKLRIGRPESVLSIRAADSLKPSLAVP
jgi:hypothetical protein